MCLYLTYDRSIHRQQALAEAHHTRRLLRQCFTAWQLFVTQQEDQRILQQNQQQTKSKMAALLDAAASGKLWSVQNGDLRRSRSMEDLQEGTLDSSRQKVVGLEMSLASLPVSSGTF